MLALMISGLLRALRIPMTRWFLFLAPLLAVYVVATGAATSAIRAGIMAVLMLAAPFCRRRPDAISGLAVAAIAILLAAPAQLGDLGFLLSFTAVAGLLALQPLFDAAAVRLFRRDEWQLPDAERSDRRRIRAGGLAATRFGLVSVSAWIATAPLTAFFFNLFSPIALGMNLLVIPAAFCILMSGVLSLLGAPLCGWLAETFNHAAALFAAGLARCIGWAADFPGGHWFVRTPPAAGVVVWYAVLAAAATMARRARAALPVGLGLLAALALAWNAREARRCRVSVLDVGAGSATLVQARSARILVDAGSAFAAPDTLRLLRAEGVNRLDALVLSHADARHVGAAADVLAAVPVGELWVPAVRWPSPLVKDVLRRAEAAGIPIRELRAGETGDWPGDVVWEVFWPPPDGKLSCADDGSLVMRIARGGTAVLLAGDAGREVEERLAAAGRSLAAAVLVAGRHGDAAATSEAFLAAVRPRDAIVSAGRQAFERHPDDAVSARLAAHGVRRWGTDLQGTIHVDLARDPARWPRSGYRIRTALP